jgi:hypothetical protein
MHPQFGMGVNTPQFAAGFGFDLDTYAPSISASENSIVCA